jgi:hypothetical protein
MHWDPWVVLNVVTKREIKIFSVSISTLPYNNHLNTTVRVVRRRRKKLYPLSEFKILETMLINKIEVHGKIRRINP